MGMFDTVVIEGLKLPNLPKDINTFLKSVNETVPSNLQTKDLDNCLSTYIIKENAQSLTTVRSGSGGTISYYGPYTIHTFTGSATFTPSFTGPVEVLVVAGGGGGGCVWLCVVVCGCVWL